MTASVRWQAGCLPIRHADRGVEVLLVTSRYTGEWIAPKGTIEPGESAAQAAAREAEEEAGVRGVIVGRLGVFHYRRGPEQAGVEAFVLEVGELLGAWPDMSARRRAWFALDVALETVQRAEVRAMLRRLADRGWRHGTDGENND